MIESTECAPGCAVKIEVSKGRSREDSAPRKQRLSRDTYYDDEDGGGEIQSEKLTSFAAGVPRNPLPHP